MNWHHKKKKKHQPNIKQKRGYDLMWIEQTIMRYPNLIPNPGTPVVDSSLSSKPTRLSESKISSNVPLLMASL